MSSELAQNWSNGICKRFQIPSADHLDEAHEDMVYSIHLRGPYLVSGSRDATVRIWNVETQRLVRPPLRSHKRSVLCVQFDSSPEQDVIISGEAGDEVDSSYIVWRFSTGEVLHKVEGAHQESILSLCFDDEHLVTSSKDRTIKVWNRREFNQNGQLVPSYSELRTLTGHRAAVNVVKVHGNTLVSGGGDRSIFIWDINTGQRLRTITGHVMGVACLQYNGRFIISGSSDKVLRVFDTELPDDQTQVASLEGHSNLVRALQVQSSSVDSQPERIVSGSYDEHVNIWQRDAISNTWKTTLTLDLHKDGTLDTNRVFNVQLDERRLICCTQDRIITGWDFASSEDNS